MRREAEFGGVSLAADALLWNNSLEVPVPAGHHQDAVESTLVLEKLLQLRESFGEGHRIGNIILATLWLPLEKLVPRHWADEAVEPCDLPALKSVDQQARQLDDLILRRRFAALQGPALRMGSAMQCRVWVAGCI
jgi:hypothetical protein